MQRDNLPRDFDKSKIIYTVIFQAYLLALMVPEAIRIRLA